MAAASGAVIDQRELFTNILPEERLSSSRSRRTWRKWPRSFWPASRRPSVSIRGPRSTSPPAGSPNCTFRGSDRRTGGRRRGDSLAARRQERSAVRAQGHVALGGAQGGPGGAGRADQGGQQVMLYCDSPAEIQRVSEIIKEIARRGPAQLPAAVGLRPSGLRRRVAGHDRRQPSRAVRPVRPPPAGAAGPCDGAGRYPGRSAAGRVRRPRLLRHRQVPGHRDHRGEGRPGRVPDDRVRRQRQDPRLRPEHRPGPEVHRHQPQAAHAQQGRLQAMAEAEGKGRRVRPGPGGRAAGGPGQASGDRRHRLRRGLPVADGVRGVVPVPGDAGSDRRDPRDQGRHAGARGDGPAPLRRRRLRQDRAGHAGGVQGRRERQAGGGARADDGALRPARPDVPERFADFP